MTRALVTVLLLTGCSSFMHFSDPTLDDMIARWCGEQAKVHSAELQAESTRSGVSFADIIDVFQAACLLRARQGANDGISFGLAAAHSKAEADMHK